MHILVEVDGQQQNLQIDWGIGILDDWLFAEGCATLTPLLLHHLVLHLHPGGHLAHYLVQLLGGECLVLDEGDVDGEDDEAVGLRGLLAVVLVHEGHYLE